MPIDPLNSSLSDEQCDRLRMTWEFDKPSTEPEQQQIDEHLFLCDGCRLWVKEMEALLTLAQQTPQYDVPEALTQRIISEVGQARIEGVGAGVFAGSEFWLWSVAAIAGAWLLFGFDAFETENGSLSWMVAFAVIAAGQYLLSRIGPDPEGWHALQK